jgi:hypothetical protein
MRSNSAGHAVRCIKGLLFVPSGIYSCSSSVKLPCRSLESTTPLFLQGRRVETMRFTTALVAAGLAGTALANVNGIEPQEMTGVDAVNTLMSIQPDDCTSDELPGNWPSSWQGGNPWHWGLGAEQVCWYFNNLNATFYEMTRASHECDADNTVYWANGKGPWKVSAAMECQISSQQALKKKCPVRRAFVSASQRRSPLLFHKVHPNQRVRPAR